MLISRSAFGVHVDPPSMVFQMPPATPPAHIVVGNRRVNQDRARAATDIAGSHRRPGAAKGSCCEAEATPGTL